MSISDIDTILDDVQALSKEARKELFSKFCPHCGEYSPENTYCTCRFPQDELKTEQELKKEAIQKRLDDLDPTVTDEEILFLHDCKWGSDARRDVYLYAFREKYNEKIGATPVTPPPSPGDEERARMIAEKDARDASRGAPQCKHCKRHSFFPCRCKGVVQERLDALDPTVTDREIFVAFKNDWPFGTQEEELRRFRYFYNKRLAEHQAELAGTGTPPEPTRPSFLPPDLKNENGVYWLDFSTDYAAIPEDSEPLRKEVEINRPIAFGCNQCGEVWSSKTTPLTPLLCPHCIALLPEKREDVAEKTFEKPEDVTEEVPAPSLQHVEEEESQKKAARHQELVAAVENILRLLKGSL